MAHTMRRLSLQGALFGREIDLGSSSGMVQKSLSSRSVIRRLQLEASLKGHGGCVNSIAWSQEGELIISGSDDLKIMLWDPFQRKLLQSLETGHTANIFCAKFLTSSSNRKIVSCDASGEVRLLHLEGPSPRALPFNCSDGITFEVCPDPDSPHVFFSCAQDGTVRQYDLRQKASCRCQHCRDDVIIDLSGGQENGIASMDFHPLHPAIFSLGCWDASVRSFDRRMLPGGEAAFYSLTPSFLRSTRPRRIFRDDFMFKTTSLRYSHDGSELLVSYSNDHVYLIRPNSPPDAPHYLHRPSDGPQTRHSARLSRGGLSFSETGPDAGLTEEGVNPTMARLSQLFQRFIDMQMMSSAVQEEEEEQARDAEAPSSSKLADVNDKDIVMCYRGHRNSHTMIKEAGFFGAGSEFVMSGSDDGRIFFWDKKTGDIVNYLVGDKHVVNCLQPHPTLPLLATSGIDDDIKLWSPTRDEPNPMEDLESVLSRNRSFMAQGEPLVIPASLLFQFLANS